MHLIIPTCRDYMLKLHSYFVKDNYLYLFCLLVLIFITIYYYNSIFNISSPTIIVPDGKQAGMYKLSVL